MKKLWSLLSAVFVTLITSSLALAAAEGVELPAADSQVKAAIAIAAGLAVAVAAFGAALGQGRVGATAMESIGRNPNAADRLFLPLLLSLALLKRWLCTVLLSRFFCRVRSNCRGGSRKRAWVTTHALFLGKSILCKST